MRQKTRRIAKCEICFQRCQQNLTNLGWKCKNCLHRQSIDYIDDFDGNEVAVVGD